MLRNSNDAQFAVDDASALSAIGVSLAQTGLRGIVDKDKPRVFGQILEPGGGWKEFDSPS
jgi:hypothetical protein